GLRLCPTPGPSSPMEQQQAHKRQRAQLQPPSQQQQEQQQQQQRPGAAPGTTHDDPSRVWLPEVVQHFARFLGGNELPCTLRLVNKATAAQFRGPQHTTVQLSLLVPHHAFARRWGSPDATRSLAVLQRQQLLCLTARSGSIANLEVLLAREDLVHPEDDAVLASAAEAGQLEACRWLRQQGYPLHFGVFNAAARAGHMAVCEWLLAEGCPSCSVGVQAAPAAAARGGHVGLMDWLLARTADAQRANDGWDLLDAAAEGCDLPTLQRLHRTYLDSRGEELPEDVQEAVVVSAAGSPTADWRDKVEWLEARGYPRIDSAITEAVQRVDDRERLEWLQDREYDVYPELGYQAALRHSLEDAMEFVLGEEADTRDQLAFDLLPRAASKGHLAVLKEMHPSIDRFDYKSVADAAAEAGQLPALAWLVETVGAARALTVRVFARAARSGSVEMLAWLRERGCPWDASVFAEAAAFGSEEQLEWLAEHGCPMGSDGQPYLEALVNADLAVLRCLRRLGCPWDPVGRTFTYAVVICNAHCGSSPGRRKQLLLALTWLVEQGCPVGWAAAEWEAEEGGDGEVLALGLEQLRSPIPVVSVAPVAPPMGQQQPHKRQRAQRQPPSQQPQQQQPEAAPYAANDDPSRVWLPEVVHHFAGFLNGNELAATLRLVNKATAAQFRGPQHTTVRLSVLVPCHAFAWRWGGSDATRGLTVRQRTQLPSLTARSGNIANLEVLHARDDLVTSPMNKAVLEAAAGAGQLEVCRWLRQHDCPWDASAPDAAAGAGHKEVCEWLLTEGCQLLGCTPPRPCAPPQLQLQQAVARPARRRPFSAVVMLGRAAGRGHRAVCEWLLTHGCPEDVGAASDAARGGHVGLMDWLLARTAGAQRSNDVWILLDAAAAGCDLPTLQRLHHTYLDSRDEELSVAQHRTILVEAAGSSTADWRDKVEWLEGRGHPRTNSVCTEAVQRVDGRERLEWLQQRGYPLTAGTLNQAAQHGNADALDFLMAQGVQLSGHQAYTDMFRAARGGHLAVLRVLHAHGVRIGQRSVNIAAAGAANGHLAVVAWGVQLGAALSVDLYKAAASSGSAEVMAWLHERGCPWNASVFAAAAAVGREEQLEWLAARGCPMGSDGQPYRRALENADLATLRCLRRLGCPWSPVGKTFTAAIRACIVPAHRKQLLLALTWLVEQGCPVEWVAAERAAKKEGSGEVLACVRQLRPPSAWARGGRLRAANRDEGGAGVGTSRDLSGAPRGPNSPVMEQQQLLQRQRTQPQPPSQDKKQQQPQQLSQAQQQQQQPEAASDATNDDLSRVWLPEVVQHFASFMDGNELACTLRLVNKATAAPFRGPQHTTVRLSVLVPHHAFVRRWGGSNATRSLTVRQREALPCLTARSGSVANLEVLLARNDLTSPLRTLVLWDAACAGQLEVCRWLRQQGCPWDANVPDAAAGAGHKEVCEWLLAEGCPSRAGVMLGRAAGGGHRAMCEWLLTHGSPVNGEAAAMAACGGHVGLMDWLLAWTDAQILNVCRLLAAAAEGCNLPTLQRLYDTHLDSRGRQLQVGEHGLVVEAAAGSHTADWQDKVEWLEGRGCRRAHSAYWVAARLVDSRERLEWLQQRGYAALSADAVFYAAQHGNADALGFLLARGVRLLGRELYFAAQGGHLAALAVLHAHGACIDMYHIVKSAAAAAAEAGQLPAVAWLVETLGAARVLTADVCSSAAHSGNAELLAWLHERGCPWDASVFAAAARAGSEEQLEWLVERGCPMAKDGDPYWHALKNADLAVLRCLRWLGCPWGPVGHTFTTAVGACCGSAPGQRKQLLLVLTWLVEQGCPVDWGAAEQEAKKESNGSKVLAWVGQLRPPSRGSVGAG
ncbi:Ankyrin repeat domain-containing protein, partial [Tetrabaena socialis]